MKRKKNTRFNLKPRTVAVIIIATIIGSMGGFLNDTLYDFSAVDENKITIKHINSIPRNKNKSTDKYGRTVAVIFKGNTNINLEMVKKGCAWNYMYYNKSLYTIFAQITAKNKKAGLWADNNPQAPWDYRKQTKQ